MTIDSPSMHDVPNDVITSKTNEWHGDTGNFIVHWFEQVRLYESTAKKNTHLTNDQTIAYSM
jgi:hypothetical protein